MAKLDPNSLIGILRGKLGDLVFVRARDGSVTVRHSPRKRRSFTTPEMNNQNRFAEAVAYVRRIREQPEVYAVYQLAAKLSGRRACDLANSDFRHAPVIEAVDVSAYAGLVGDCIRVRAIDDFAVIAVEVSLKRLDGALLENGLAHRVEGPAGEWIYLAQTPAGGIQTIVIEAAAIDRPGNRTFEARHHALT